MILIYTDEQIEYLKRITPGRKNTEITKMFNKKFNKNKTESAIKAVRQRNRIIKQRKLFTKEQEEFVLRNIKTPDKDLVKMINKKYGLNIKNKQMGNWRTNHGHPTGIDRAFDEGSITTFKNGYSYIKISSTGNKDIDWVPLHKHEWEKVNGKIPKSHVIVFLDSNKENFNIDNLYLIHKRILLEMNRRGYFSSDPEMTLAGIATCQLIDKLREHDYMQGDRKLYEYKKREAESNGISEFTFLSRLKRGWSLNEAATMKVANRGG